MLLLILFLLSTASIGQNIDDSSNDGILDSEFVLSNETTDRNTIPEGEGISDLLDITTTPSSSTTEAEVKKDQDESTYDGCGRPPVVRYAVIVGERRAHYEVGSQLTYSCEFGYSTDSGNYISRCYVLEEGSKPAWTDPRIICIPRSCGDPGLVLNAHRIGSRFTFPNQVSFECDEGYELRGSATRYCQASGRWSGSLPSCQKIFCDQPIHPDNGKVSYNSLEYGSQLTYDCETGFILKNHQNRMCTENGTWSGPEPLCLDAQCEMPFAPEHGSVEILGGNPRVGSIAVYKCESGKLLLGSATSKCLEIGEWTFKAPKCVDPCIVPNVQHGKIGRYESKRYTRQKVYSQLQVGSSLKDGEELYLSCDNQHEPLGKNEQEVKIKCEKGQWLEAPTCIPARCRSKPPDMSNGRAATINRQHGGYVVYYCSSNFKKTVFGNVTCHYGTWRGFTPTCSDRRCYVDRIPFPGIVKGSRNVFKNRELFRFECEKGYEVAESEKKLTCEDGTWKGHLPPCKAASCLTSPPSIQNGRIKFYSDMHSSSVTYECEEGYFLRQSNNVQCLFGEWTGAPPVCIDGRCYFQNLKYKNGLVFSSKDPVDNGEALEVKCALGYSSLSIRPLCSNGQWTEYGTSPCKANNCQVVNLGNGAFTERVAEQKFRWNAGYVKEFHFHLVSLGRVRSEGERLFVRCDYRYSFQGIINNNDVPVVCSEGRWKPTPVCLLQGTYYEEKAVTENFAPKTANQPDKTTSANRRPSNRTVTESSQVEECLYQGSNDLVAYSGVERLKLGSRVKSNASVKFHCLNFGFHRLMGPSEIICKRPWHSSEYPSCVVPVRGDVIIQIDEVHKILPGGILYMEQGTDGQLKCISNGYAEYPVWSATVNPLNTFEAYNQVDGQDVYFNVLDIQDANSRINGIYSCSVGGKRSREIQILVQTKCEKFDESDELNIYYDNKQETNSSVLFTCKDPGRKLDGPNVLTCLVNGEWSGHPPKCLSNGCPKLPEVETMLITYSQEQAIGSQATFHCFAPRVRKGDSFINCLRNGAWSGTVPTCALPRCPLENLFQHIPENVVPDMENVINETLPYGFELHLTCEGDLRLTEPTTAKCGNNGVWEVPKVGCIPGCSPIPVPPDSNLVVDPKKDFYRFGESVSFQCDAEHILSVELEIVMCLRNGWSDNTLPTCLPLTTT